MMGKEGPKELMPLLISSHINIIKHTVDSARPNIFNLCTTEAHI